MSAPVCQRCGTAHYNFTACAKAQATAQLVREMEFGSNQIPLAAVLSDTPDGFRPAVGWGQPDGFGRGWGGVKKAA